MSYGLLTVEEEIIARRAVEYILSVVRMYLRVSNECVALRVVDAP